MPSSAGDQEDYLVECELGHSLSASDFVDGVSRFLLGRPASPLELNQQTKAIVNRSFSRYDILKRVASSAEALKQGRRVFIVPKALIDEGDAP
jgi:hypothetical protein